MPTGIGSRKVLTPRSSKNPRRSLPHQAKLIEAASFESFDDQPSSPDIMTTKLMEKVKNNNAKNSKNGSAASNSKGSSLNQRLTAAATTTGLNSLVANSGRSKLSTEEFNVGDYERESSELNDKYKKNNGIGGSSGYNTSSSNDKRSNSYNTTSNNSYNSSNNNNNNNSYNSSNNNSYNTSNISSNSYTSSKLNNSNISSNSYTSKPNNYNPASSDLNNSRSVGYSKPSMPYSDIGNSNFDRWNGGNGHGEMTISSLGGGESIELLQEQVNHLRREYEGLKQRFSDLSRLRLSEPEEMLEEHKKLSELRDQAAERTIKTLQKENEQLKKQLTLKINEKSVENNVDIIESKDRDQDQDQDDDFMLQVEKILKIYSSFSGLKITPTPSNPLTEWHCEFSSRSGQFDFQLIYESELNRYQYIPIGEEGEGEGEGRLKNLPQFLASDILITADQMQIFFWRLLDTLTKKPK